jgi:hypothetical protein
MEAMVRKNPKLWMLVIYLFLVSAFLYARPGVAFDRDGTLRPFGTGGKHATVFPLWYWVFAMAVVSYLAVVWVLDYSL